MTTTDRTGEFFAIADARCQARGRTPTSRPRPAKTAFGQASIRLSRALHATQGRTARLSKLACKSSLFDDPAAEIGEITVAVRQELAAAGSGLDALGAAKRPGSQQFAAHAEASLAWLRARIAAVTAEFQTALKQREATISAKESRAKHLGVANVSSPFAAPFGTPASSPPLGGAVGSGMNGGGRLAKPQLLPMGGVRRRNTASTASNAAFSTPSRPGTSAGDGVGAGGTGGGAALQRVYHELDGFGGSPCSSGWSAVDAEPHTPEQLQSQQFWTPRSQKHRAQEVSQMQTTLAELGSMFQRFGAVVAEQGELIDRIDANTDQSLDYIEDAHTQILSYQRHIKGNRGLILKTFGVLFFIVIVYGTLSR